MHRFFVENLSLNADTVQIVSTKEIHHLKNVLRIKKGDQVSVFDGKGRGAEGQILKIQDKCVSLQIKKHMVDVRNKKSIILACAIPKNVKFESIIEKCTELGVNEIIPLKTKRTEVLLSGDRAAKKLKRYHAIAINASKQCRRRTVPVIHPVAPVIDALEYITENDAAFISCLFDKTKNLIDIKESITAATKRIFFFIGPEGDFTQEEVSYARKKGCKSVSLGDTTLKVDTAAIVVVAFAKLYLSS